MITLAHTAGASMFIRKPARMSAVSYSNHYGVSLDDAVAAMIVGQSKHRNQEHFVYELHGSWSEHVKSWTADAQSGRCMWSLRGYGE